ncbi:hypothetical protein [Actinomadura geliboluensis]|uniref:hypothetical protein n=1 Tax=Actinomadura geliboluensis TaxID=882440 RepID=UPI00371918CF
MSVELWALIVAGISTAVAIVAAAYAASQAHSAADSASSAVRSADAANEQVAVSRDQLALAKQIQREQNEPYVVVDIQPASWATEVLLLVIENIGPTVARNVKFSVDPPFETSYESRREAPLREANILTKGIPTLPPGRRIEILFDVGFELFKTDLPKVYEVTVEASGPFGPVEPMRYIIDLEILLGYSLLGRKTVHQGVKELEKLRKAFEERRRA